MLEASESHKSAENERILLDLLNSVERDGGQSQRRLASELGIALGLVNAYLRRCVKKGLVKATEAPARRCRRAGEEARMVLRFAGKTGLASGRVLSRVAHIDLLTAYLATSPGGADSKERRACTGHSRPSTWPPVRRVVLTWWRLSRTSLSSGPTSPRNVPHPTATCGSFFWLTTMPLSIGVG